MWLLSEIIYALISSLPSQKHHVQHSRDWGLTEPLPQNHIRCIRLGTSDEYQQVLTPFSYAYLKKKSQIHSLKRTISFYVM